MTSANVVVRIAGLSPALVGRVAERPSASDHGLQHAFFRHVGLVVGRRCGVQPDNGSPDGEGGYSPAFVAALIAAASTIAQSVVPPSIMAVVYGASVNVWIAGLFSGRHSARRRGRRRTDYVLLFFRTGRLSPPWSSFRDLVAAMRAAALPRADPRGKASTAS